MIAVSRRWAKLQPAHACSSRASSSGVKTGTSLSVTRGGCSPAIGSGSSSSAASHLKKCCKARYWLLAQALLWRSSSHAIHRWMSWLLTCSQLARLGRRAAANHRTASV